MFVKEDPGGILLPMIITYNPYDYSTYASRVVKMS